MTDVRRPREAPGTDGRTTMARVSDGLPPKFYDPARGRAEPPAVTAARKRHQAISAEIERRALAARIAASDTAGPGPDDIGCEWRRETLEMTYPCGWRDATKTIRPTARTTRTATRNGLAMTTDEHMRRAVMRNWKDRPAPRITGTLADAQGRQVTVGVLDGKVTLRTFGTRTGAVELDGVQCEEFARVYLSACWQAAQELARTAAVP